MSLDSNLVEGGVKEAILVAEAPALETIPEKPLDKLAVECAWKVVSLNKDGSFSRGWRDPTRADYQCVKCKGYNPACPTYHPMPDASDF